MTFRDLLNFVLSTAIATGCEKKEVELSDICWEAGPLVGQMEQVDPARASKLSRWGRESSVPEVENLIDELTGVMESGSVDELLAMTAKYPQSAPTIYRQAALKAAMTGDFDRARQIANDYLEPERRQQLLAQLERLREWTTLPEEKLAEIQKTLNTIPDVEERIRYLLAVANRIGLNNPKAALKLLDQATEIANGMKTGKGQTSSQIELASMYCLEKSDRGFSIIESLIPKFNELVAAGAKLDGYDNEYLRDGEWTMTAEGGVGDLLTRLAQNAGYFAWLDFDRAVALTAQFERPEIRMMAQLKLAQGILAGPPLRMPIAIPTMH
jgi:hypothetical protein